jgi:predicted Zn-dependent protease
VLLGEAGFVIDGGMAYEILGYTYEQRYRQYRRTFLGVVDSYARLTDRAALDVQPRRIALYRVPTEMSAREVFLQSGADEESIEELTLLNNLRPDELVGAGELLKIVEPPLDPSRDSDNAQ